MNKALLFVVSAVIFVAVSTFSLPINKAFESFRSVEVFEENDPMTFAPIINPPIIT